MTTFDRRSFLKRFAVFLALVFSGGSVRSALAAKEEAAGWLSIGPLDTFADGVPTVVKNAKEVGGMKIIAKPMLLAWRRGAEVHVMSLDCPHKRCQVDRQADGTYVCPCHRAAFSKTGEVTKGPAKSSLPWYATKVAEGAEVQVNTSAPVPPPKLD